jgi:phosphoribosylformylglycinamidine cyclo-ligase
VSYRSSGVDYDVLDEAKRRSLRAASSTWHSPGWGASIVTESVGEPTQLIEVGGRVIATVLECLGTKSSIAADVAAELGVDRFEAIGFDTVAAAANDLCCAGALPVCLNAYVATGSPDWYAGTRHASFVAGFEKACREAGAAWVGGESPTLRGIVEEGSVDLAASAVGLVPEDCEPWLAGRLEPGDEIVLLSSSGLHANGASLVRSVASRLEQGWSTTLPSGRTLGEAALDESVLYSGLVGALHGGEQSSAVHYASHVTGHGLRKLMRARRHLTYRLTAIPEVPEVLAFVASVAGMDAAAAYGTFNMGVGFALFVAAGTGGSVLETARHLGYGALSAGTVEEGRRRVILEPLGIIFESEELSLC